MAIESVAQAIDMKYHKGGELALYYVEAALEAHGESFGDDDEKNRKMQWAVTGLLQRALQLLNNDNYGKA